MGSFSNFRSFFSNHLLSNTQSQNQSQNQQRQQKASLDDRSLHSFNPHYQHNLHSTAYSTPPSLASSPTNSSPTSTTSSSSNSSYNKARYSYSTVNGKGVKSPPQHSPQYFPRRSYYHQQQIQQQQIQQQQLFQQQQNSRQHHQHRSAGHQYQQNRRSYRNHHSQANLNEEDELSLGSSSTATAMDLASPIDPSPLSVSMWQGRRRPVQRPQQQQQGHTSHILVSRASETEKHASRASSKRSSSSVSRPQWSTPHSTKRHSSADQFQYLSSSPFTISEPRASTAVSYMQDMDVSEDVEMPSSTASSSSSSSSSACDKMDAKTSLMRIAQCGRHEDSWCALHSGQYTRHYAESRSGVTVDGRRARRM